VQRERGGRSGGIEKPLSPTKAGFGEDEREKMSVLMVSSRNKQKEVGAARVVSERRVLIGAMGFAV